MLDYNLETIKNFVRKAYPEEDGELSVFNNAGTDSIFAYAIFVHGEEGDEVVLDELGIVDYYGLPIKVQRTLTKKQIHGIINQIKTYPPSY